MVFVNGVEFTGEKMPLATFNRVKLVYRDKADLTDLVLALEMICESGSKAVLDMPCFPFSELSNKYDYFVHLLGRYKEVISKVMTLDSRSNKTAQEAFQTVGIKFDERIDKLRMALDVAMRTSKPDVVILTECYSKYEGLLQDYKVPVIHCRIIDGEVELINEPNINSMKVLIVMNRLHSGDIIESLCNLLSIRDVGGIDVYASYAGLNLEYRDVFEGGDCGKLYTTSSLLGYNVNALGLAKYDANCIAMQDYEEFSNKYIIYV